MAERHHERGQLQLPLIRRAKGGAREVRLDDEQPRLVNAGRDRSVAYLLALAEQRDGEGETGAGRATRRRSMIQ